MKSGVRALLLLALHTACGAPEAQPPSDAARGDSAAAQADRDAEVRGPAADTITFEADVWPGEGIPVLVARRAQLPLRGAPRAQLPAGDVGVFTQGAEVPFDSTRHVTLRAVRIDVLQPARLEGARYGTVQRITSDQLFSADVPRGMIDVTPEDRLEFLQYQAEGSCFVRLNGVVAYVEMCPTFDESAFRPDGEPETEWWVYVTTARGAGWLIVGDSTLEPVERRF